MLMKHQLFIYISTQELRGTDKKSQVDLLLLLSALKRMHVQGVPVTNGHSMCAGNTLDTRGRHVRVSQVVTTKRRIIQIIFTCSTEKK